MKKESFIPVVTIDGPVGSGKSTISYMLAQKLNWHFLNSGALYRALAIAAKRNKVPLNHEQLLADLAKRLEIRFISSSVWLSSENITDQLSLETTGNAASKISVYLSVRNALIQTQRNFRKAPGLIAEGRDMGTVIFPDAFIKIFLEASVEKRAERRYHQLLSQGLNVKLGDLVSEIAQRDQRDKQRQNAPLIPAKDAIVIDTTKLSLEQVFEKIMDIVSVRLSEI